VSLGMIHVDVVYIGCTYSRTYVVASWLLYKHCIGDIYIATVVFTKRD
jgi:hypothetical protein